MRINEFSYRHGKELLQILHPDTYHEIKSLLEKSPPFVHGEIKGKTAKEDLTNIFTACGWIKEEIVTFSSDKKDAIDLYKSKIAIEMEFSRFEMFFRDFFRFMLMYEREAIDVGIIITLDEMAYERWHENVKSYRAARASLQRLIDFLTGDYSTIVKVPLYCIGIE